jgi:two-component system response regulator YesN
MKGDKIMSAGNSLLRVLVVDDEPYIRKGLAALIDWEAEGYSITGEATNGETAIQLLTTNYYDLIISDIKMPQMDGIEFITYVKSNKLSDARFIFLSGYYDFQYAKTAIQYGCCDYILKPIQKKELLSAIRRIMDDYRKETGKNNDRKDNSKAYLDHHIMAVLWGKYDSVDIKFVQDRMKLSGEIAYVHCEISQNDEKFMSLSKDMKREQQRKLYYYASLLLKNYSDHIVYEIIKLSQCYDMGIIFCSYMAQEKDLSPDDWIKWLQKEMTERIGYKVVAFMGCMVNDIDMLADSYREAVMIRSLQLNNKYDTRDSRRIKEESKKHSKDDIIKKQMDELIHVIEVNDKPKLREDAKAVYKSMMDKNMDPGLVSRNIQYLMYRLLGLAYKQDTDIDQEEIMQYIRESVFISKTGNENCMRFQQFVEEYSDYLTQMRQDKSKGIINLIEAEIEDNYADNISLKYLAEKYYFNSAYLGQLFKKQYGCSFKEYLNNIRIRKAAEMILHTDKKVYEVAVEAGYKNLEYFINKFEEVYGVTPTGFRKRNNKGLFSE